MFEYWYIDENGETTFTGMTNDFLEVACQLAKHLDPFITGNIIATLLETNHDKLEFLRVVDWNFEQEFSWLDGRGTFKLVKTV